MQAAKISMYRYLPKNNKYSLRRHDISRFRVFEFPLARR